MAFIHFQPDGSVTGTGFDLEYMQGMAAWKSAGAQYVGISYESDRPVFQCELPNGGKVIQDHPVYWHFANGVEMYTLRELFALNENHFELHSDDDEPYEMIGESMGWVPLGICENEVHLAEYDLFRSLCLYSRALSFPFLCIFSPRCIARMVLK